jgi:hypothetical protein
LAVPGRGDATCENQRNRAGEAVMAPANEPPGGPASASKLNFGYNNRFQTRAGLGGEKESKWLQMKTQLDGVRF